MASTDKVQAAAEATHKALRDHGVPPTPRNFEVWFAYCSEDKHKLRQRIDRLIQAGEPFTPGVMDSLHQDFFAYPSGTSADDSRELRNIATQLADRITADHGVISDYGAVLGEWGPLLDAASTRQDVQRVTATLKTATSVASGKIQALEQLFAASVVRIGELHEKLARSEKDAATDPLTGLANRRAFNAALEEATAQAVRDGTEVSLLLLDIDHFKRFNDVHGHLMGDNVLRLVAQVLTRHIKGRDTAARYGGEEYAVILAEAGMAAALTVADQVRDLLEKRPLLNRKTGESLGIITCSIGVALYRPEEAMGDLIDRADKALYRAKQTGRNRVVAEETILA
jgi:diguanylate cyclase